MRLPIFVPQSQEYCTIFEVTSVWVLCPVLALPATRRLGTETEANLSSLR